VEEEAVLDVKALVASHGEFEQAAGIKISASRKTATAKLAPSLKARIFPPVCSIVSSLHFSTAAAIRYHAGRSAAGFMSADGLFRSRFILTCAQKIVMSIALSLIRDASRLKCPL
jgi:hypothetical protein